MSTLRSLERHGCGLWSFGDAGLERHLCGKGREGFEDEVVADAGFLVEEIVETRGEMIDIDHILPKMVVCRD